ncbi:MAG: hypothetical protein WA081_08265 [Desulfosalsimonadaceae bacterium]
MTKNYYLNKSRPLKTRFAELAVGLTVNQLTVWAFDFFLYPFVIYEFGVIKGGMVMTFLSFLACIGSLRFYDWSKRDWLGIETIKGVREYNGEKSIGRFTSWILKKSNAVVFLFLSIKFDAFITTAYMRHGKYNGMGKREWGIFMGSLLISNIYWTLACLMGVTLLQWGWLSIKGLLGY